MLAGLGQLLQILHGPGDGDARADADIFGGHRLGGDALVRPAKFVAGRQTELVVGVGDEIAHQEEFVVDIFSQVRPIVGRRFFLHETVAEVPSDGLVNSAVVEVGRIEFQDGNARGRVVADGHPVIGQEEDVVLEPLDGRLGLTDSQTGDNWTTWFSTMATVLGFSRKNGTCPFLLTSKMASALV